MHAKGRSAGGVQPHGATYFNLCHPVHLVLLSMQVAGLVPGLRGCPCFPALSPCQCTASVHEASTHMV